MGTLDPANEYLRLSERYRDITDGELIALARRSSELTDVAQQALASEVSRRRLEIAPEDPPPPPEPAPSPDSPYAEERELVELCTIWSRSDALQLQWLLDRAGIPFFMGPEKATGVDSVAFNFAEGVVVRVMRVGLPWANQTMREYVPENEPAEEKKEIPDVPPVRCPKCRSEEVIFEALNARPGDEADDSPAKFKWTCDSCGHEWEDDGIAREA
jgi:DNA-directed RNA polymerase subunit M/transcription elongation factor TFIIS